MQLVYLFESYSFMFKIAKVGVEGSNPFARSSFHYLF